MNVQVRSSCTVWRVRSPVGSAGYDLRRKRGSALESELKSPTRDGNP